MFHINMVLLNFLIIKNPEKKNHKNSSQKKVFIKIKPQNRAVAVTAISQYRAIESITAEECNNRSNRDISFFS